MSMNTIIIIIIIIITFSMRLYMLTPLGATKRNKTSYRRKV